MSARASPDEAGRLLVQALQKRPSGHPGSRVSSIGPVVLPTLRKQLRDVSSHENEVIGMRLKPRDSVQNSIPLRPSRRRSGSNRAIRLCEAVSHTESEAIGNRAPSSLQNGEEKIPRSLSAKRLHTGGCTI